MVRNFSNANIMKIDVWIVISLLLIACVGNCAYAEDWLTYQHDNRRSGITRESISFPLQQKWKFTSPLPPQTAWPGPAKWDSFANIIDLKSMRDFDPVFYTTVSRNRVFWGSSVDDSVHCAGLNDGKELWIYCTDGPVRLPPSIYMQRIYFGSDDGRAYCLKEDDGSEIWTYKPSPDAKLIPSDGKPISQWPCRTGVFAQNDIAYFAASLFPWQDSYLCAVDASSGNDQGDGLYKAKHIQSAMQGPILASETRLYLSQGRQQPQVYDIKSGALLGSIGQNGDGGCFAILMDDEYYIHGRGQNHDAGGELRWFNSESKDHLATFPGANCMLIEKQMAYYHADGAIAAFDREKNIQLKSDKIKIENQLDQLKKQFKRLKDPKAESQKAKEIMANIQSGMDEINKIDSRISETTVWKRETPFYYSMILAGDALIVGGKNIVAAYNKSNGEPLWSENVNGGAYGLTYANGHLLVSTDGGEIVCFMSATGGQSNG